MDIDTLLESANPRRTLTLREEAELGRLIDAIGPRPRRRARWIVGVAALVAIVLTGGATAVAATTGILKHPTWYDAASDWSSAGKTVTRHFVVDGVQHSCTVTFTVSSNYNGKGIPEYKAAVSYFHSLNLLKVQPDAELIKAYTRSTVGPDKLAPRASANESAWTSAVAGKVWDHVTSLGLDSSRISVSTKGPACDVQR